jgi:hypothetical protein
MTLIDVVPWVKKPVVKPGKTEKKSRKPQKHNHKIDRVIRKKTFPPVINPKSRIHI